MSGSKSSRDLLERLDFSAVFPGELHSLVPLGEGEQARRATVIEQIRGPLVGVDDFVHFLARVDVAASYEVCVVRRQRLPGEE